MAIIPLGLSSHSVQSSYGLLIKMDLEDLDSVQQFTDSFKEENIPLDILINNAGIMACPETRTPNGWESQFAIKRPFSGLTPKPQKLT